MSVVGRVFKYIEPLWVGEDGKISLRAVIAIVLTYKLLENVDYAIQKWQQGTPLGEVSTIILTLAGLIPVLLGITAWSNMTAKKIDIEALLPPDTTVTVEKAETVVNRPIITSGNSRQTDTLTTTTNTSTNPNEEPVNAK